MSTCRRMKVDPYLSPCTKLKSKWIKDININLPTFNLIEEKVGSSLQDIGTGDHFLGSTPVAQTIRESLFIFVYGSLICPSFMDETTLGDDNDCNLVASMKPPLSKHSHILIC